MKNLRAKAASTRGGHALVAARPARSRSHISPTPDPSVHERVTQIVMIEDEPGIGDFVKRGLGARGFRVSRAFDGDSGLESALGEQVSLVLLDLMLPGRPGLEVLTELAQRRPGLPVIVLTARGQLEDRVEGLDAGAADYLVKPFMLAELEARIRAQLRSARQAPLTEIRAAGAARVSDAEPGHSPEPGAILRAVWGYTQDPGTNIVDVYIGYLRRKLGTDERQAPIKTVRSLGYRLDTGG